MLKKVVDRGIVTGLLEDFRQGGIMALQYVDDTILFLDHDMIHAMELKLVLRSFE